jgi:serine/threonine protein kinase/pSer/pThr/pTyr-binding forkhead associated (FHA) protein
VTGETQLGPFTIERELGRGGMGVVYAARREGRPVALKVALDDVPERDRKHFLSEAELLSRISHPGVVEILDSGTLPDRRPYLAMPLLAGQTLADRLQRGRLDPDLALRLFAQLAGAVAALHDAGIVHRDIKAENVMYLEDEERLVLLDFGIAREIDCPASTTTRMNLVRGTPGYMAPERFFGMRASASSDVYELAVVLYAMVAGRLPWDDPTDPEARLRPRHPAELGVDLPVGLGHVLLEALSTRPERRPSARELAVRVYAIEGAPLATGPAAQRRTTVTLPAAGGGLPREAGPLPASQSVPPGVPPMESPPARARSIEPPLGEKPRHEIPAPVRAAGAIRMGAPAPNPTILMGAPAPNPPIALPSFASPLEQLALVVEEGPNRGERLPLPMGGVSVVGRATDAQVRLPEDDKKVSRYQAVLEVRAAGVEVQDLNSRNGTFVNGARVTRSRLGVGDVLRVGRTSFRLAAADLARAPTQHGGPAVTEAEDEEESLVAPSPTPSGRLVPAVTMSARQCSVCGAPLLDLQSSPWQPCTLLCDACAARIRAGRRGDEPAELGGFEVLRFLESGGMGLVYDGRQRATGVRVALKVLCPAIPPRHPLARRFLREQRLMKGLVSDRIVRCYTVSTAQGRSEVYIAMEFVPGGSAARVARPTSNLRQIVWLAADVFDGLAYGHERGLVHRDVKPANVLLTLPDASGLVRAKLADYGLAKNLQEAGGSTTATGRMAGSPLFAAPEQLLDLKRAGASADIYGAAATLYWLLTGNTPLPVPSDKTNVASVCAAVLDTARVPLRARRPDVPVPLADWLDAMLLRDPVHRSRVRAAEVPPWLRAFT